MGHETAFETWLQHLGEEGSPHGSVVPPLYQASLFTFEDYDAFLESLRFEEEGRHCYSRMSNPTVRVFEDKLAAMEGTECAVAFASGMGAISSALLSCVGAGDHVVYVDTAYGPTKKLLEGWLRRFGVESTPVTGTCPDEILDACRANTKLIALESPSSFLMRLQDLRAIGSAARERGIATMIDNSYATPILQRPAEHGIDLVVHSASKYLGGHSDAVAGVVCGSKDRINRLRTQELELLGACMAPFTAWLLVRGMRTLPLRLRRHEATGNEVAGWLEADPRVDRVHHVGLMSHPQRELIGRQMGGSGGLLSFEPKTQTKAFVAKFIESLRLFKLGVSWGGHESLVVAFPMKPLDYADQRWVVRLFCGLEEPEDLIDDLDRALRSAESA